MFANNPGDLGSIPGRVIPKTLKMVLDTNLLKLSHITYVSRVKWSNPGKGVAPTPSVVVIGKGAFGSPSTTVTNLLNYSYQIEIICITIWFEVFLSNRNNLYNYMV